MFKTVLWLCEKGETMKVEAGGGLHCKYNIWVQSYIKEQSDKNGKWFGVGESFT